MTTLRYLSIEYSNSKITKCEYRKQRTEFLEGILAGEITVPEGDILPPLSIPGKKQDVLDVTQVQESPALADTEEVPKENNGIFTNQQKLWFGIISVLLILIATIIVLVLLDKESDDNISLSPPNTIEQIYPILAQKSAQIFIVEKDTN